MMPARILAVETDADSRKLIEKSLESEGFSVETAESIGAALARLKQGPSRFDAVLLSRNLGEMDGLPLLHKLKAHPLLKIIPVVVNADSQKESEILECLRAGAHSFLGRPLDPELLRAVVGTAVRDHVAYREMQGSVEHSQINLSFLQAANFSIRTLDEAQMLGRILAFAYPDADLVVVGLSELLINAVEHGNLEIGYETKSRLLAEGAWQDEINRRLELPRYRDRRVEVDFRRNPGEIRVSIRDQGHGFDWSTYLDVRPERVLDSHGRGIAIAKEVSFDDLEFSENGREVVAINFYPEGDITEF